MPKLFALVLNSRTVIDLWSRSDSHMRINEHDYIEQNVYTLASTNRIANWSWVNTHFMQSRAVLFVFFSLFHIFNICMTMTTIIGRFCAMLWNAWIGWAKYYRILMKCELHLWPSLVKYAGFFDCKLNLKKNTEKYSETNKQTGLQN